MKLKWKIALPVLALLVASTLATTLLNSAMTRNSIDQIVDSIVHSNLDTLVNFVTHAEETEKVVAAEKTKNSLATARAFSEIIALNAANGTLDLEDAEFFQSLADQLGVTEINVTDDEGTIIGSNFADYRGWNYGSTDTTRRYLQILDNPSLEIAEEIRQDALSGSMLQYFGVARRDEKGFVQVGFDANIVQEFRRNLDITKMVAEMSVGNTGNASIIESGVVTYSHHRGLIGQNVSSTDWFRQISSGGGEKWMDFDGEDVYAGYRNVGSTTLLVQFPRSEYNGYLNAAVVSTIVGVIVALLIPLITFYLVNRMLKPLVPLTAFMQKASATGDLEMKPEDVAVIKHLSNLKDELGQCISASAAFVVRITEVSVKLGEVADGDLTVEIVPLSDGDTLGKSLNRMNERLNLMFGDIQNAADEVSRGSRQTAEGSQALAQGSTQQAASIQELSNSISAIAKKTIENAEIAGKTSKLADEIRGTAEKGSSQMNDMMEAVRDINQASQSISKIIKVIDDIAFQTNILALNAAVEAARAGQHGKGFAVVAEEVRNLASKSAEAARNTGTMIQDSVEKAELGSRIAGDTAASLTEIVSGINESSRFIAEIAKSSEEQSLDISQVTSGIDQVAQVVQQNSATAEESAATSQEMSTQSALLQDLIAQFKLKENQQTRYLPDYRH